MVHLSALLAFFWWCAFWSLFSAGASLPLATFSALQRLAASSWWGWPFISGHAAADAALFLLGFRCGLHLWRGGGGAGGGFADAQRRASAPLALLRAAASVCARLYAPFAAALLPAAVWGEAWTACRSSFTGGLRWAPWGLLRGSGGPLRPRWCAPPAPGEDASPAWAPLGGVAPPRALPPAAYLTLSAPGAPLAAQSSGAWLWPAAVGLQCVGALGAGAGAVALLNAAVGAVARRVGSRGGALRATLGAALREAGRRRYAEGALLALLGALFFFSTAARLAAPAPPPLPGTAVLYTPRAAEAPLLGGAFTAPSARAHAFAAGALAARAALGAGEAGATPAGARFAAALGALAVFAAAAWDPSQWYAGGGGAPLLGVPPPLPPAARPAALALSGPLFSLALAAALAPAARSPTLNGALARWGGSLLPATAAAAPFAALLQPSLACALSWAWGGGGEWGGGAPRAAALLLAILGVTAPAALLCATAAVLGARAGAQRWAGRVFVFFEGGGGGGGGGGAGAPSYAWAERAPSDAWVQMGAPTPAAPAAEWPGGRLGLPPGASLFRVALPAAAAAAARLVLNTDVGVVGGGGVGVDASGGLRRRGAASGAGLRIGDDDSDSWDEAASGSDASGSGSSGSEDGDDAGEGGGLGGGDGGGDDAPPPSPIPPPADGVGPGEARLRVVARLLLGALAEEARAGAKTRAAPTPLAAAPRSMRDVLPASLAPGGLESLSAALGWGADAAMRVARGGGWRGGGGAAAAPASAVDALLGAFLNRAFRWGERARAPDDALRALASLAADALADAEGLLGFDEGVLGGDAGGGVDAGAVVRLLEVAALVLEGEEEAWLGGGGGGLAGGGAMEGVAQV